MPQERDASPSPQIQRVIDAAALTELVHRQAGLIDSKGMDDITGILSLFTPDVLIEFPGGSAQGAETLMQLSSQTVGAYETTQHVVSNVIVDHHGDVASVTAHVVAYHVTSSADPDDHFDVGASYDFDAVRTPDGWRLSRMKLTPRWSSGRPASAGHASALFPG